MSRFDQSGPGFDEEPLSWVEPDGINDYDRQIDELTRMFMEREMSAEHNDIMLAFVGEQIADNIQTLMGLLYFNFTSPKEKEIKNNLDLMQGYLKQHITRYVEWDYHDLVHLLDQ